MSGKHFFPPSQLPGSEPLGPQEPLSLRPRWPSRALRFALLGLSLALGGLIAWMGWARTGTGLWLLGLPGALLLGVLLAYRVTGIPRSIGQKGGPVVW